MNGPRPGTRIRSRIGLNVLLDGLIGAMAVPLARWIADPSSGVWSPGSLLAGAATLLLAGLPFRLPLQYWRFAGLPDLIGVAGAAGVGAAFFVIVARVAGPVVPPGFPVVHALVLLALLGAPRLIYRRLHSRRAGRDRPDALLVGSAADADIFLAALGRERVPTVRVTGLLLHGERQIGRRIQGLPILGTVNQAASVLARLRDAGRLPAMLVVASPGLAGPRLAALIDAAEEAGVQVRRAARATMLSPATAKVELAPVSIDDLLDRPLVPLDRDGIARLIQGARVVVTGAGGTIGAELARQIAGFGPERLVLIDNGEYALWQIDVELSETHAAVRREPVIADVRDAARLRAIFDATRPALVFHAAALKHVPMVEANPLEGLLTNAVGTRHVADAALAAGARALVLISTDKAVNPSSVMGASKRLAELYCQALDRRARREGGTRCVTVRFGNVLGSTGSVVPLFQRQLARGGPLTVTHPDMQRYFMTVREAVGLVLQASVRGAAGMDEGIYVLDMGQPVRIADLARRMISLSGLRPEADVAIRFTGLRPGEKLHEELFHGQEALVPTGAPGLLMARPRAADVASVASALAEIEAACRAGQIRAALARLGLLVPEFDHKLRATA